MIKPIIFSMAMLVSYGAFSAPVYNASECAAFGGTSGLKIAWSNIHNASTTEMLSVDCPMVNESTKSGIKSAWIDVVDLSVSEDVSCTLYSISSTQGNWISSAKKTSGVNSGWQRLSFPSLKTATGSHVYFSCKVPKKTANGVSEIGAYSIVQ